METTMKTDLVIGGTMIVLALMLLTGLGLRTYLDDEARAYRRLTRQLCHAQGHVLVTDDEGWPDCQSIEEATK
jgi:hypothetical protein